MRIERRRHEIDVYETARRAVIGVLQDLSHDVAGLWEIAGNDGTPDSEISAHVDELCEEVKWYETLVTELRPFNRRRLLLALCDPGAIVGHRHGPSWEKDDPAYSNEQETLESWQLRAIGQALGIGDLLR